MKNTVHGKDRRTAGVPVTTMEELPILSDDERAEMIASLKAAEARIASGEYVEHDSDAFIDRLTAVRASATCIGTSHKGHCATVSRRRHQRISSLTTVRSKDQSTSSDGHKETTPSDVPAPIERAPLSLRSAKR